MNSYDIINYKLRPQKRIERALFSEMINCFSNYAGDKINYIGMGSLFFVDFTYFKKTTNIKSMISIESMNEETPEAVMAKETRFENNKPLAEIKLLTKLVKDAIEDDDIPFNESNFIWLDYDNSFYPSYIRDLSEAIFKESKTSIFAITYSSGIPSHFKSKSEVNTKKCYDSYSEFSYPGLSESDFTTSKYADTVKKICDYYIRERVKEKNTLFSTSFKLEHITDITYKDGKKMYTIVYVLHDDTFDNSCFIENMRELKIEEDINLTMEILSLYEKQLLDRKANDDYSKISKEMGLSEETIEKYYKYAKYIPEYTEILI